MGGAFTSIGGGVIGIPYNPASVAFIKNQEGFLSKTSYVADISYHVLGYGRNLSGIDYIAFHGFFLDSGSMDVTNELYPDGTVEQYSFRAMCFRAAIGKRITNRLRIGVTGKFIREEIYTTHMQSFAMDIGSNFNTGIFGFVIGMSIVALGTSLPELAASIAAAKAKAARIAAATNRPDPPSWNRSSGSAWYHSSSSWNWRNR